MSFNTLLNTQHYPQKLYNTEKTNLKIKKLKYHPNFSITNYITFNKLPFLSEPQTSNKT